MQQWRGWLLDPRLLFIGGALAGIGLGLLAGWIVWPVTYYDTDFYDLRPDYQDDFVVMVGALDSQEADPENARRLLSLLSDPSTPRSPESIVVDVTERYIALGRRPDDIADLVGLAEALGTVTAPMRPYLSQPRP